MKSNDTKKRGEVVDTLDRFTFETALLFFRMRLAATQYVGQGEQSAGHRSVLKTIGRDGPQTVPAMARVRAVSRQHVQKLVDGLRRDGLVRAKSNPSDRRSKLIVLTRAGERFLAQLTAREVELFRFLGAGMSPAELRRATRVVRTLRERLESEAWGELVEA